MAACQSDRERFPELYIQDRDVDPQTPKHVVPMKILALSMPPKQAALETLGYGPTIHVFNQWMQVRDVDMWEEGLLAKYFPATNPTLKPFGRVEFDQPLGDHKIVSDNPSIAFIEDLVAIYPEGKVIIVERDVDAWYKSFYNALIV